MMRTITAETPLPQMLRGLRVGQDDEQSIRRAAHLAAAKIEDLQARVDNLAAELARVSHAAGRS
jgi:hypothetical protein